MSSPKGLKFMQMGVKKFQIKPKLNFRLIKHLKCISAMRRNARHASFSSSMHFSEPIAIVSREIPGLFPGCRVILMNRCA